MHVAYVISFTSEIFIYLYTCTSLVVYVTHFLIHVSDYRCRKTCTCMYCTSVSAITPIHCMCTMNVIDKTSDWLCRRTAVRADTCSIVAISLNLQEKVHPVIWSLGSLPFDCCQVLAVPRPIGNRILFDCYYIFVFLFI